MTYKTLLYEKEDGIGIITINRPEVRNALNDVVNAELCDVFEKIERDPEVRVAILTGSGEKAFVSGADIDEMQTLDPMAATTQISMSARRPLDKITGLSKPVIAALNGHTLGGGCELAMACDLRVAAENARFGQPEINLGIIPGGGGTQRLPRLIGMTRAKELLFTGDLIDANTALSMGLVNKVVPQANVMAEAKALAAKLMTKSSRILALLKKSINSGINMSLPDALDFEAQCFILCFSTEDQKEGMKAFKEKRKPEFKNR